jgi:hypothetical protein
MGFWSQVTGVDAVAAAVNAVLMEHTLVQGGPELRQRLVDGLVPFLQEATRASGDTSASTVVNFFNRQTRPVQLNLLVAVAAALDVPPAAAGAQGWHHIRNPMAVLPPSPRTWERVRDAQRLVLRELGIDVHVPHEPFTLPDPIAEPGPVAQLDELLAGLDFDEQHQRNDDAYDEAEIGVTEYMQEFRRLLLEEVRATLRR